MTKLPDAYVYQPYPKALYHRTLGPCLVRSREEHDAKGEGWAETPAAFQNQPPEAALPEAPAEALELPEALAPEDPPDDAKRPKRDKRKPLPCLPPTS